MFKKFLFGTLFCKYPIIKFKNTELITEVIFKFFLIITVIENLLWHKITQQFLYVIISSFTCHKLTCRNIQETYTTRSFTEMNSGKKVIFLIIQYIVTHGNTRSNKFCYSALHHLVHFAQSLLTLNLLSLLFRVFKLVANSHTLSGTNKFW